MDYQNFIQITNQTLNEDFSQKTLFVAGLQSTEKNATYRNVGLWRHSVMEECTENGR